MAFDDLTPNQRDTLIQLIEALNTGEYHDEFVMFRHVGQVRGDIRLYSRSSVTTHRIEGFTDSDLQALKEEGYLTQASAGRATLKPKAYQQFNLHKDPLGFFQSPEQIQKRESSLDIFISHSSKDKPVAEALINLLRDALSIPANRIRCTSVDGYRLPAGASTDEQLRQEIYATKVFIGLITPTSFQSTYVLFELGARWGARLPLVPVLASGADASTLRAPLTSLNALSCDEPAQVHQLLDNVASLLGVRLGSAASYQRYIDALVQQSKAGKEQAHRIPIPIQVDEQSNKKAKLAEAIRQLGELAEEGDQLLIRYREKSDVDWTAANDWASKVEEVIKERAGEDSAAYFSLAVTKPYPGPAVNRRFVDSMHTRIQRIGEIVSELRAR